jgi:hypothetical protein
MKLFIATVALTTALALPAFAGFADDPNQDNQTSNSLQNKSPELRPQPATVGGGTKVIGTDGAHPRKTQHRTDAGRKKNY